ncbi:hypothetical protein [Paludisphaera rhizosphaerae]|uniref:hypothetical protein n=1 Tax=Paludisphaera rhizosphaerae TaxID=2711216 RepID=UPI0013EDE526|nr:hypothetical protein [Paludisphaera rhizosphaerae]
MNTQANDDDGLRMIPTREVLDVDGVECRRWIGTTPDGGSVELFVHRVGTGDPRAEAWLDARLSPSPTRPPESLSSWILLDVDDLAKSVVETAERNFRNPNRSPLQRQCDELVLHAARGGEVGLATCLQFLQSLRVLGAMSQTAQVLFTLSHEVAAMRAERSRAIREDLDFRNDVGPGGDDTGADV